MPVLADIGSKSRSRGVQSFAAGAILTMLADTMFPEAFETGGDEVGLATALGFAAAFLLSRACSSEAPARIRAARLLYEARWRESPGWPTHPP